MWSAAGGLSCEFGCAAAAAERILKMLDRRCIDSSVAAIRAQSLDGAVQLVSASHQPNPKLSSALRSTSIIPLHIVPANMDAEEDTFTSVTWENRDAATGSQPVFSTMPSSSTNAAAGPSTTSASSAAAGGLARDPFASDDPSELTWAGYLMVQVLEPRKELEGQKDAFISYGIRAETNLAHFSRTYMATRRRFNDFTFLREGLKRDFPACVVAPLPDKHRLEYLTGDRFSTEFIERRTQELQLFLERICRHPTLQRSQLLRSFLESSEWHVDMHAHNSSHSANSAASGTSALVSGSHVENAGPPGLLDSISDHFLNAFSKVRKPDQRFEEIRESIDKLEEGLAGTERVLSRNRNRIAGEYLSRIRRPRHGAMNVSPFELI